jgi:hypothetical protein
MEELRMNDPVKLKLRNLLFILVSVLVLCVLATLIVIEITGSMILDLSKKVAIL